MYHQMNTNTVQYTQLPLKHILLSILDKCGIIYHPTISKLWMIAHIYINSFILKYACAYWGNWLQAKVLCIAAVPDLFELTPNPFMLRYLSIFTNAYLDYHILK